MKFAPLCLECMLHGRWTNVNIEHRGGIYCFKVTIYRFKVTIYRVHIGLFSIFEKTKTQNNYE